MPFSPGEDKFLFKFLLEKQGVSRYSPRMKRYANPRQTLVYVTIAVLLMIAVFFVFDGKGFLPNFERKVPMDGAGEAVQLPDDSPVADEGFDDLPQPEPVRNVKPEKRADLKVFDYPLVQEFHNEIDVLPSIIADSPKPQPQKFRYSLKNPNGNQTARIAIVIDDMGIARAKSRRVIDIDSVPLTLAFLPYASNLASLTGPAKAKGHELMIHMPMEPMNAKIDTGPIALFDDMNRAEIDAMMDKAFASFDGYVGINNHMGSRLTQNAQAMGWVMESLADRDLFYVDSKTIGSSIAADSARVHGLDYAVRDVFLDHEDHLGFVRNALAKTERVALEKGYAIAIGHPKTATITGLKEWIPTLESRGFEIVPVSALLMGPEQGPKMVSLKKPSDLPGIEPAAGGAPRGLYRFPGE